MTAQTVAAALLMALAGLMTGCDLPGKPKPEPEVPRPEAVLSFDSLYGQNCAGCHGANGQNGAAIALANPEYQAIVDEASLRKIVAEGEQGTRMPAFGVRAGGELTDAQIDAVVRGMRQRWNKSDALGGQSPPPYKATHPGDSAKGQAVYAAACARCHGQTGDKPGQAGSILNGSFLALINEQTVRTIILAGRPDIGQPDWRGNMQGRAMTDDEITNVTAWLMAQRPPVPGQPYPDHNPASEPAGERQSLAVTPRGN